MQKFKSKCEFFQCAMFWAKSVKKNPANFQKNKNCGISEKIAEKLRKIAENCGKLRKNCGKLRKIAEKLRKIDVGKLRFLWETQKRLRKIFDSAPGKILKMQIKIKSTKIG